MGTTVPDNWLKCNNGTFSSSTYPELYAVLGNSTQLPDFRGRFPLGVGKSDSPRSTNHTLKSEGGEESHILTIDEMPSHSHDITYREGEEQGNNNTYSDLGGTGVTDSTEEEGGDDPHNNMPPFYTVNFIIKAK